MRIILTLITFFATITFIHAQDQPNKCGTPPQVDPWLTDYLAHKDQFWARSSNDTLNIPMHIHLVGGDNGTGAPSLALVWESLCRLRQDFDGTGIEFFVESIDTIYNSAWSRHPDVLVGAEMMFANNKPNGVNNYIVYDPAGNCGYNLPYGGIAVGTNCMGPNQHTWAHEMGHQLSLPHPFLGWEGKTYDPSQPTPETVTYDYTYFKDTLIIDTVIIDTTFVEYLDMSNCTVAADQICDTAPDYLSYRWNCGSNSMSSVTQKDPAGNTFKSDGTLIMSYADDACQTRFSPEEIMAMRSNLETQKANYLIDRDIDYLDIANLTQIQPLPDAETNNQNTLFSWTAVPGATGYILRYSIGSTPSNGKTIVTTDTFAVVGSLFPGFNYSWDVLPYNMSDFCVEASEIHQFIPRIMTSTRDLHDSELVVFPNPILAHQNISLAGNFQHIQLIMMDGQVKDCDFEISGQYTIVHTAQADLPQGIYILRAQRKDGKYAVSRIQIL